MRPSSRGKAAWGTGPTHGIASTYRSSRYACRCEPCTEANTALQRREYEKRTAKVAAGSPDVPHGTVGGYRNWGCRCDDCSAAHRDRLLRDKARRVAATAAGSPAVPHGTRSGYQAWGCRCDGCRAAELEYDRKARPRKGNRS